MNTHQVPSRRAHLTTSKAGQVPFTEVELLTDGDALLPILCMCFAFTRMRNASAINEGHRL